MRTIIAALTLAVVASAYAQDATLNGKVTDASTGEALIGVNVVHAPGRGVATDVDGAYTLVLPAGTYRITFSFIGYTTRTESVTLTVGEHRTLDTKLAIAANQLDAVVVTAGRFEQRVGEVTQSLSVLRPEIILNKNIISMSDALDQVPGVVIIDEEPQIRAGSGFSYGAGSRVQVCVDDVPILSGDIGRPNWTFLPLENLEQVEVIKGASSVLYGSAALSGVINVRTAYPRAEPSTRVTTFAGIYDTPGHAPAKWWDQNQPGFGGANFFHSRRFGQLDLVLGGNAFTDNGYIGPEPQSADSIALDPYRLGPGGYEHRVRFNSGLRWRSKGVEGLSFGLNSNVMKSRSTSVFIWSDTDRGLYRPKQGTVTRTLGTQFYLDPFVSYHSLGGTRHSLRTRWHRQIFDNDNGQGNSNSTTHAEYQAQQKVDLFGETVLTGGLLLRNVVSTAELYNGDADGDGKNTALNTAAYLQADKKLCDEKLSLSAGVRYEQFTVNDDVAGQPVFRAGATYRVLKTTYVRASYGQGFRYPTIGERFINTSVGLLRIFPNADIRPEQSWNTEVGIKQGFKLGGFMGYLDVVAFQQEFQDYVEFTFGQWEAFSWSDPAANFYGFGFKSVNTGGARVTGLELELAGKGRIGSVEIQTLIGYTTTKPISTTPDDVYAEPVPGPPLPFPPGNTTPTILIPASTFRNTSFDPTNDILKFRIRNTFRADVQLDYRKVFGGFSVRYNSHVQNIDKAFVDLDEDGTLVTGVRGWMETHQSGTTIVDARAGVNLSKQLRVALIVNNLTNEVYSLRPLSIEAPRSMQVQLSSTL
ncbi:MAG: TonB-dependent receptor [Flavobacteriales bacterium]|nr:TonB-dependent receptor [Flavobacteriales bacterium]